MAAEKGTHICGRLVAQGSNVNDVTLKSKCTSLHPAVLEGHQTVVEAFISWGAIVGPRDHAEVTYYKKNYQLAD